MEWRLDMQVYEGIVQDRVVVLPKSVHLVEGLRVEIRVPEPEQESLEDLFKQSLVEAGLIEEIRTSFAHILKEDRTLLRVEGQPLSQMIVEERR
jgi:hypothetical protein